MCRNRKCPILNSSSFSGPLDAVDRLGKKVDRLGKSLILLHFFDHASM